MLGLYLQQIDSEEGKTEFEIFYYEYRKLMYYIAMDYLHDSHLSEDAVSETFIKLAKMFDKIQSFGDMTSPQVKRYVVVSVKNTALNILKQKNRHHEVDVDISEIDVLSEDITVGIIEKEDYNGVIDVINSLPNIYRDVLQVYAICEHDVSEVSSIMGISKDAAYKRIQRARLMLKERMGVER